MVNLLQKLHRVTVRTTQVAVAVGPSLVPPFKCLRSHTNSFFMLHEDRKMSPGLRMGRDGVCMLLSLEDGEQDIRYPLKSR